MIRLATRGSALALAQAELARGALVRAFPGERFELEVVDSDGDLSPGAPLPELPGRGWFTSRLERELLLGRVEGAVHSAKDLPTETPPGVTVGALLARGDPRDAVVCRGRGPWRELPPGARVGTSSPRRGQQLLALRPDLRILPLRGNVDSRLRRVDGGQLEACVLALAGLERVGRADEAEPLDPLTESTPAPAQGAIAIEVRRDSALEAMAGELDDSLTRACVEAERLVLTSMGGGCELPLGALARPSAGAGAELIVAWGGGEGLRRLVRRGRLDQLSELARSAAASLR